MKPLVKGNLSMFISKTFSGLNENALRYLLPTWMSAYSGVVMRLVFGSVFFWIGDFFRSRKSSSPSAGANPEVKTRAKASTGAIVRLLLLGAVCVFGYMFFLLEGLTYTTPISSSIFISLQPVWVFLICVVFLKEKVTPMKIIGILLGLGGALLIILTQQASEVASNPALGNLYCLASSLLYSVFLVLEKRFLVTMDSFTVNKWAFLGGSVSAFVMICFTGWHAPVLHTALFSTPMLVLLFVLLFPTAIGYLLLSMGLRLLSATVVALYGYLILIVAAIVSYLLGQDRFDWWQILSMALIFSSVYFVEIAERRTAPETSVR